MLRAYLRRQFNVVLILCIVMENADSRISYLSSYCTTCWMDFPRLVKAQGVKFQGSNNDVKEMKMDNQH
jgi:hypothetical protein